MKEILEERTPAVVDGRLAMNVGIETLGGILTAILPHGQAAPCSRTEIFSTAQDHQAHVAVRLFRGIASTVARAHFLGEVRVTGFAPAPRGVPKIEVTLAIEDGRLVVSVPPPLHVELV